MKATFLSGFKPLVKVFTPEGVDHYPMVKNVTSHEYDDITLDKKGVQKRFEVLKTHARQGNCLLKGGLSQPLVKESRAGKSLSKAPNHSFILDFDNVALPGLPSPPYTQKSLREIAERLVDLLPEFFQNTTYIAHASASMGTKPGVVSMHIEFLCSRGIEPKTQRLLLKYINLTNDTLKTNIQLSANARSLKWPVDVCLADNSRMIFIAPPVFKDVQNPFKSDDDRFTLAEKDRPLLSTDEMMEWLNSDKCEKEEKKLLRALQKAEGFENLPKEKEKNITVNGVQHRIVVNPPEIEMEADREYEHYITYNCNGGDSHAYYVLKNNPAIVHNWKGEKPFLFQKANENAYNLHIETYGIEGVGPKIPIGFRDVKTDTHFAGLFDPAEKTLRDAYPIQKANLDDFYQDHGGIRPDPVPQINYDFDPQNPQTVDWAQKFINRWIEPPLMEKGTTMNPIEYDNILEVVEEQTPTIYKIVKSAAGNAMPELQRFINWLAFIVQYREKTQNYWLFQGVQGTGKGILYSHIIKPILREYSTMKRIPNLAEEFNDWHRTSLLVILDEFKAENNTKGREFMEKFKHMVTEHEQTLRAMRANQVPFRSYSNFILFTNQHDALPIEATDRRANIFPRQEIPIHSQFPDIREMITHELPKEVEIFSEIIHAIKVNVTYATTSMENTAKSVMRETTLTAMEEFAYAMREGDFDYFSSLLSRRLDGGMTDETSLLIAAKNILKGWIKNMYNGRRYVEITSQDVRPLYHLMVGKIESERRLMKALMHQGIHPAAESRTTIEVALHSSQSWEEWHRLFVEKNEEAISFPHERTK